MSKRIPQRQRSVEKPAQEETISLWARMDTLWTSWQTGYWNTHSNMFRLIVLSVVAAFTMAIIYYLAVSLVNRDWRQKQQRARQSEYAQARAAARQAAQLAPAPMPQGTPWRPSDERIQQFMERLEGPPDGPNWWLLQTSATVQANRGADIGNGLRLAMKNRNDAAEMHNLMGIFFLQNRNYARAQNHFKRALVYNPELRKAHYNLALCRLQAHRGAEAIDDLARYAGRHPDDLPSIQLLGRILQQQGRWPEAFRLLNQYAAQSTPVYPIALDAANLAAHMGDRKSAIRLMDIALETTHVKEVAKLWQRPIFRRIRQDDEGVRFSTRLATRARGNLVSPDTIALPPRFAR